MASLICYDCLMKTAKLRIAKSKLSLVRATEALWAAALVNSLPFLAATICLPASAQSHNHQVSHAGNRPFEWPTSHNAHTAQSKTKPDAMPKAHAVAKIEPTVKFSKTPTLERIVISTDRLFDPDQTTIMPGGEVALSKMVEHLSRWREHPVVIECHTDSFGFDTYIRKLSQERAERLRVWFLQRGLLDDVQVTAIGVGKGHPIAPNQTPDGKDNLVGMAANRRIEIIVDKTKAIEVAVLDPIHQSIEEPSNSLPTAPIAEKQDWTPPDVRDSGDLIREADTANAGSHESNPIIDSLPTQESAQKPRGTQDSTSQAAPAKVTTEEQQKQHEWDHKEFGVWREDR
ncbi:MAG: hypothetical protein C0508_03505 [Cyanobacteria bacterium PR.023]|nr:hypothetical protein [Cyanobacteria bacterium PR.023]